MKELLSILCVIGAIVAFALIGKGIISFTVGAIIAGLLFIAFVVLSVIGLSHGMQLCDECGRPMGEAVEERREALSGIPNCPMCCRPYPPEQYNS